MRCCRFSARQSHSYAVRAFAIWLEVSVLFEADGIVYNRRRHLLVLQGYKQQFNCLAAVYFEWVLRVKNCIGGRPSYRGQYMMKRLIIRSLQHKMFLKDCVIKGAEGRMTQDLYTYQWINIEQSFPPSQKGEILFTIHFPTDSVTWLTLGALLQLE